MTQIEFITGSRVGDLSGSSLYDYILERIIDDKIIILEKELGPDQQMELIARALEKVVGKNASGINYRPFYVTTQVNGLIRNKQQEVQFNLITPATAKINETDEGHYSVTTPNGETISAVM